LQQIICKKVEKFLFKIHNQQLVFFFRTQALEYSWVDVIKILDSKVS